MPWPARRSNPRAATRWQWLAGAPGGQGKRKGRLQIQATHHQWRGSLWPTSSNLEPAWAACSLTNSTPFFEVDRPTSIMVRAGNPYSKSVPKCCARSGVPRLHLIHGGPHPNVLIGGVPAPPARTRDAFLTKLSTITRQKDGQLRAVCTPYAVDSRAAWLLQARRSLSDTARI